MRLNIYLILVFAAVLAPALDAQKSVAPANGLKDLEVLLGSWDCGGVMHVEPGVDPVQWTSKNHFQRTLGNKFIREDAIISFGAPLNAELAFITFYVWSSHEERLTTYMAGSDGVVFKGNLEALATGSILSARTMMEEGKRVIDRWVMKPMKGGYALTSMRAVNDQEPTVFVTGTMKRMAKERRVSSAAVGSFIGEVPKEMKLLGRMAGKYTSKGQYAMSADQPMTPFEGQEEISALFGGTVLQIESAGPGYEAIAFAGWDAQIKRYRMIILNSWGMAGTNQSLLREDGQWVASSLMTSGTIDMLTQTRYELDEEGHPLRASAYTLMEGTKPFKSFEITYSPLKK